MSLKFESEAEIAEKRKVRDEEWAKVRKPEDPIQAPEPIVDNRSLYDRLQDQKNRAKEELEESKKLKHLVKLLEEDECDFLDQVDEARVAAEKKKRLDEARELLEFRDQVAKLREQEIDNYIKAEVELPKANNSNSSSKTESQLPSISVGGGAASSRNSQTKLLASIVKRKNPSTSTNANTTTSPENHETPPESKRPKQDEKNSPIKGQEENSNGNNTHDTDSDSDYTSHSYKNKGNLICIGEIKSALRVLPGLGSYSDSDDSSNSSSDSSDDDHQHKGGCCSTAQTDLCGRRIEYVDKKDK